jgi:hypothetical protein
LQKESEKVMHKKTDIDNTVEKFIKQLTDYLQIMNKNLESILKPEFTLG